ncbi:MAG: SusC/RagA family TonB-linked outer membrane protein, partial [Sphingobacteriaceae bacterium]
MNSVFLNTYRWTSPASVQEAAIRGRYYSINAYANYENTFNEKHYVKLTAGYNEEYNYRNFYSVYVRNLIDQQVPAINLNNDPAPRVAGNSTEWALTGTFFRLNYSFNNRYLLEVNGRYDGTSRYQRGNRYTFLPSVSAGWRVSEEGFFKNIKNVVNDFKIRGSYGTLGNQITADASAYPYIANDFPYIPTIPVLTPAGGYNYIFGTTQGIAVNAPGLVNPNFTWEKVTSKDLGVDISLLNSRLTATGDVYIRDTRDMLAPGVTLPATLGTAVPQVNAADLRTKGWELSLTWNDRFKNGLSYSLTTNLSDYQSTITRYNGNPNRNINNSGNYGATNSLYQGLKLGEIWGFETDRYFTNDAEAATSVYNQSALFGGTWRAGDIRYRDLNGDGKVDFGTNTVSNSGDRRVIGNSTPRYQYGFIGNVAFKGFDLNFILQGVGKRDVWLGGAYMFPFAVEEWDVPLKSQLDYWTPQNTDAYYARLRFGGGGNYQQQTKYLQNGAYLRMKNITFGYTIPSVITKRANL